MSDPLLSSIDGYVPKILFANGQILHHYHLNSMQDHTSKALKEKTTRERFDLMLLFSPFQYLLYDPLVDDRYRDSQSSASRSDYYFNFTSGVWLTKPFYFPSDALLNSFMIIAAMEENKDIGSTVSISYRTTSSGLFVSPDEYGFVTLTSPSNFLQLRFTCNTTGITKPAVFDYGVIWK